MIFDMIESQSKGFQMRCDTTTFHMIEPQKKQTSQIGSQESIKAFLIRLALGLSL